MLALPSTGDRKRPLAQFKRLLTPRGAAGSRRHLCENAGREAYVFRFAGRGPGSRSRLASLAQRAARYMARDDCIQVVGVSNSSDLSERAVRPGMSPLCPTACPLTRSIPPAASPARRAPPPPPRRRTIPTAPAPASTAAVIPLPLILEPAPPRRSTRTTPPPRSSLPLPHLELPLPPLDLARVLLPLALEQLALVLEPAALTLLLVHGRGTGARTRLDVVDRGCGCGG